jgi:ferredoxin-type protein NapF
MDTQINSARRNLLRGLPPSAPQPVRPPGAVAESLFAGGCTACGECVDACPQGILFSGSGGFPEVSFRNAECTFCARCIDACSADVLQHTVQPPWRLQLRIRDRCLAVRQVICQTCGDACDAEAIRFRPQLGQVATPEISAGPCTGCGACVAACPEDALEVIADDRR